MEILYYKRYNSLPLIFSESLYRILYGHQDTNLGLKLNIKSVILEFQMNKQYKIATYMGLLGRLENLGLTRKN